MPAQYGPGCHFNQALDNFITADHVIKVDIVQYNVSEQYSLNSVCIHVHSLGFA